MGHANNKRERQEQIEFLLLSTTEPFTPTQIAEYVRADRTTIHRDLDEMSSRCPIMNDGQGHYSIDRSHYISNIKFSPAEALSIYLALRRFARQTTKAPDFIISALRKVAHALHQANLNNFLNEASLLLEEQFPADPTHAEIWQTLIRGWFEGVVVRVWYQKAKHDEVTIHEFEPYLFEPAILSHGVYVIGWSHQRKALRTLKLDRIQKAALTTAKFEPHTEVTPATLLEHSWGVWYGKELHEVKLHFAPSVAARVQETIWHPSQEIEVLEDGSLYWTVRIAGMLELVSWIRGWGHEVKVLAPEPLKQEIAESLRQAARLYDESE